MNMYKYRFVNLLNQNQDHIDDVWKIVKQVRKNFLTEKTDPICRDHDNQISLDDIKTNIDNVEKHLTRNQTNHNKLETDILLQIGAEMFIYLSICPPKLLKFYEELLVHGSIKDIILAFTNIMKTRRNAEKSSATKLWSKLEDKLKFLNYKKLESLTLKTSRHSDSSHGCETKKCSKDFKSLGQI